MLAHQPHHLGQPVAHHGKVALPPRLAPGLLTRGVGAGLRLDQIRRHGGGPRMGMAHQGEVGGVPRPVGYRVFGGGEVVGHGARSQLPMRQPGQHRELVTTRGPSAGRHHRRGVPAKHGRRFVDGADAGEAGHQAIIGGHGRSGFRT